MLTLQHLKNTALGRSALSTNTTGCFNTAVGESSMAANTTGCQNTAVGSSALTANTDRLILTQQLVIML